VNAELILLQFTLAGAWLCWPALSEPVSFSGATSWRSPPPSVVALGRRFSMLF